MDIEQPEIGQHPGQSNAQNWSVHHQNHDHIQITNTITNGEQRTTGMTTEKQSATGRNREQQRSRPIRQEQNERESQIPQSTSNSNPTMRVLLYCFKPPSPRAAAAPPPRRAGNEHANCSGDRRLRTLATWRPNIGWPRRTGPQPYRRRHTGDRWIRHVGRPDPAGHSHVVSTVARLVKGRCGTPLCSVSSLSLRLPLDQP